MITKKYLKVIDKNKKRILETPDITIPNQDLEEPYYWPYEPEKLTLLIEDLKTHKFIEQPENNISSFDKKDDPDRIKIKWIGTIQRNLFFLLFAIYDENEVFKKEKITDIALKLFDFKYTTEYNLGKNYNKVRSDFLSSEYVSKKQSLLKSIVRKLDLPPLKQAPTA